MTLRSKTFLPLAFLSALFLLFLYGYWFPQSLRNVEREELRATTRHLNSVAEGLVPLLLAHQLDTVYENLDALLSQNKEWVGIRLINPGGALLYPLQEQPSAPSGEHVRVMEHRIQYLGSDLGRLILRIDISAITAATEKRHLQLVTALLIVFCGYLLSIGIIVERIVRRPVKLLAHAAEEIAQGNFEAPLVKTGHDEVGILVDSFAGMRDAIRNYQATLHEQTVELEEEMAERQMVQENLQEKALLLEEEIEKRANIQDELEQLNESLEERVMLAELSAEIGCDLTTSENLQDMLQQCSDSLVRHLDAAFARIWTFNDAENCLELQASAGMYTRIDGSHSHVPVGKFKIGLIAAERKPHITNAVLGDPLVHDQEWAKQEGMVAFAGHPLVIGDKLVGVMAMFSRNQLSDVTLKALGSVSNAIAIGIERKRNEKALEQLNEELEQRVMQRTADLERLNKIFIGRELRMIELKERIRELEKRPAKAPSTGGPI